MHNVNIRKEYSGNVIRKQVREFYTGAVFRPGETLYLFCAEGGGGIICLGAFSAKRGKIKPGPVFPEGTTMLGKSMLQHG